MASVEYSLDVTVVEGKLVAVAASSIPLVLKGKRFAVVFSDS
jgi:hypothetical protein